MTKELFKKIFKIQTSDKLEIIKNEINKFQNYTYFTENQIFKVLKPLLKENNLSISASDDKDHQLEHSRDEKREYSISYLKEFTIIDVESGESKVFYFWATGNNTDFAKAKGSAETYAMKYFLSKLFLIPIFDNLDPDVDKNNSNKNLFGNNSPFAKTQSQNYWGSKNNT